MNAHIGFTRALVGNIKRRASSKASKLSLLIRLHLPKMGRVITFIRLIPPIFETLLLQFPVITYTCQIFLVRATLTLPLWLLQKALKTRPCKDSALQVQNPSASSSSSSLPTGLAKPPEEPQTESQKPSESSGIARVKSTIITQATIDQRATANPLEGATNSTSPS